ncbi:hypothetical protein H4R18_005643 [Coemansia javaensis]|uniref:Mog1p/PsbP-like protein n=1 Tax=Coemansia javaensis TaxID=2761396 RepID=A0A9W8H8H5_9FUNG|nr:hypothetical protein H4R18_005643 [Coemansia javaensis]
MEQREMEQREMEQQKLERRALYGGAMSMDLPAGMVDVSRFREVPDNQEVFADDGDRSVIVEILESVDVQGHDALRWHFAQVAELNEARQEQKQQPPLCAEDLRLDAGGEACVLAAEQRVAKFNERAANRVWLAMALLRVPDHAADVLVTMNWPLALDPASSSAGPGSGSGSGSAAGGAPQPEAAPSLALFKQMVRSLAINDYGLFP